MIMGPDAGCGRRMGAQGGLCWSFRSKFFPGQGGLMIGGHFVACDGNCTTSGPWAGPGTTTAGGGAGMVTLVATGGTRGQHGGVKKGMGYCAGYWLGYWAGYWGVAYEEIELPHDPQPVAST